MKIAGFTKTTLLDFPEHVAATIFTAGCDFKCPFCHNRALIAAGDTAAGLSPLDEDEIFAFLRKRKGVLTGVCISGGEPTLQKDLPAFIRKIKNLGYLVKLDTNGHSPLAVADLLADDLLDYIAMDVKNTKEKYALTAGINQLDLAKIETAVEIVKKSGIAHEFRTTVVKELHTLTDLLNIAAWLAGGNVWYLQAYQDNENVLRKGFTSYSAHEMDGFAAILRGQGAGAVKFRGG